MQKSLSFFRYCLGDTKECAEFAEQFLKRYNAYKSQQSGGANIDQAAMGTTPSMVFQEVKVSDLCVTSRRLCHNLNGVSSQ